MQFFYNGKYVEVDGKCDQKCAYNMNGMFIAEEDIEYE